MNAESFPFWSAVPFAGLLAAIAFLPLAAPHWWHANRNKALVSAGFALPALVVAAVREPGSLTHAALEYTAFVCLLGSLYTISGGIRLAGGLTGTPLSNAGLLAAGGVLANLVGTTGASMLLIRPLLEANRGRRSRVHVVVFFLFVVANVGGCLTPLGDPPLFLGFLRGVPFAWTLRLWREWLFVGGTLLALFFAVDSILWRREGSPAPSPSRAPMRLSGSVNVLLLFGVATVVLASGLAVYPRYGETASLLFQSAAMSALGAVSWAVTPRELRRENGFSWHPLGEVAVLFAGIFVAMIPALAILRERGAALGVSRPWEYFWATGLLSAFLDNAPTYLSFLSLAQHLPDEVVGTTHAALEAISCGAVFFGAMTYIGNGPNFMVKAVAEHDGVRMPSFFGYVLWSGAILLPLFAGVTVLFLRGAGTPQLSLTGGVRFG
ncbi:MAG TPA: sodium:proton antiporter [Planctomycetota bacterium]|nr:sodium:proton antiporter [Planctomycetota bacterium]